MEEKVKVVFEFSRKEFEFAMFMADREMNEEAEKLWTFMTQREIKTSSESIAKAYAMPKREVSLGFIALAITETEMQMKTAADGNS